MFESTAATTAGSKPACAGTRGFATVEFPASAGTREFQPDIGANEKIASDDHRASYDLAARIGVLWQRLDRLRWRS